ncbi:MAG TPA: SIMPL domain-containing protein [Allosphingosinicella sp.]|nr:SIMPL domain-containing protein [Allosphingosinicella sp.]
MSVNAVAKRGLPTRKVLLIAASLMAGGVVVGGYLLGDGLRRARMADRAVTVRGLAERDVTADLATWTISFTETGSELEPVRQAAEQDSATVVNFFRRAGFQPNEIDAAAISVNQFYDENRGGNVVTVRRQIQLRTRDIAKAQQAYSRQADLIRAGVAVEEGSSMVYNFIKLNDVKPEMIALATQDARRSAEQFARDSGTDVGGIRTATQGYFSISARDGNEAEEGSGRNSPLQKVRVVTTVDFFLS